MSNAIGTVTANVVANTKGFKAGMNSSVTDMRSWQRQAKKVFTETQTPMEGVNLEIARLNRLQKLGLISTTAYTRKIKQLNASLVKTSVMSKAAAAGMRTLASSMLTMIGPLAAIGGAMAFFRMEENIDRAMRSSLAIMGDVGDKMVATMQKTANEVAFNTVFSTEAAAKAYFFLASAGLDAQQSLAALPVVAKFAQAGMFDLSTATDLLTDAQMAMGLSSKNAAENMRGLTHVGNVLVGANRVANATVQQFSEALTNKGANAARLFGLDLEEATAILALFASQGIKGAEAGTRLDILLRNLALKATENKEAFKAAGVAVFGTAGEFRKMSAIAKDLTQAMAGMGAEEKAVFLLSLGFTAKTITVTAALLGMSDQLKQNDDDMRSVGEAMDDVSGKQMTDFQEGWEKIKASFASGEGSGAANSVGGILSFIADNFTQVGKEAGFAKDRIDALNEAKFGGKNIEESTEIFKAWIAEQNKLAEDGLLPPVYGSDNDVILKKFAESYIEARDAAQAIKTANEEAALAADKEARAVQVIADKRQAIKDSIDDTVAKMKLARDTAGMSSAEKELLRLKRAGADDAQLAPLRRQIALDKVLATNADRKKKAADDAMKAQKKANKLQADAMKQGKAITDSLRTAEEIYRDQLEDLRRLRSVGAIDDRTLQRGQMKALADLRGGSGGGAIGGAAGSLRGSAAARQSFVGANEMLKKAETRNRLLKDIKNELANLDQPDIAQVPA